MDHTGLRELLEANFPGAPVDTDIFCNATGYLPEQLQQAINELETAETDPDELIDVENGHLRLTVAACKVWTPDNESGWAERWALDHAIASETSLAREMFYDYLGRKWEWIAKAGELIGFGALGTKLTKLGFECEKIGSIIRAWAPYGPQGVADGLALYGGVDWSGEVRHVIGAVPFTTPFDLNPALEQRLMYHTRKGTSLAMVGRRLVSGAMDRTARVWNVESGECELAIDSHASVVTWLEAIDEEHVAAGTGEGLIYIHNLSTGDEIQKLFGHSEGINDGALVGGDMLVTCAWDEMIAWEKSEGGEWEKLRSISTDDARGSKVVCALPIVAALGGVKRVATGGGADTIIRIWRLDTGEVEARLDGHTNWITGLRVMPGGRLASSSDDGSLGIWRFDRDKPLSMVPGEGGEILAVEVLDQDLVATGGVDGYVKIWDTRKEPVELIKAFSGHIGWVMSLKVIDSSRLASIDAGGSVLIWNYREAPRVDEVPTPTQCSGAIALSDGRLVTRAVNGTLSVWEKPERGAEPRLESDLRGGESSNVLLALPNGGFLVGGNCSLTLWTAEQGGWSEETIPLPCQVRAMTAVDNGGSVVLCGSEGFFGRVSLEPLAVSEPFGRRHSYCLATTPDGRIVEGARKRVSLLDLDTAAVIEDLRDVCRIHVSSVIVADDSHVMAGAPGGHVFVVKLGIVNEEADAVGGADLVDDRVKTLVPKGPHRWRPAVVVGADEVLLIERHGHEVVKFNWRTGEQLGTVLFCEDAIETLLWNAQESLLTVVGRGGNFLTTYELC